MAAWSPGDEILPPLPTRWRCRAILILAILGLSPSLGNAAISAAARRTRGVLNERYYNNRSLQAVRCMCVLLMLLYLLGCVVAAVEGGVHCCTGTVLHYCIVCAVLSSHSNRTVLHYYNAYRVLRLTGSTGSSGTAVPNTPSVIYLHIL